ncbi:hypothetical protein [Vibrio quintilis]|uniref:hypothetical protein n=1 Tax=Vibrio quintilis TaxID=1117707 RepID=UPI0009365EF4|nr:hypothetical protein [Vibrio quintilis]
MSYSFEDKELTSEKSLWDVYKLSRRILPGKFQVIFVLLTMLALGVNAFVLVVDDSVILRDVRKWSEYGFNFSITTLGFLIAGFTIFATLSKPQMMLAMMEHTNKETGLRTLKYNFFTFMKVFIAYIAISIVYLLVIILGQADGFIPNFVALLPNGDCVKSILIKVSYALIGSSFVYLLLLLKSFVFNIYAIVMNFLRWEYHEG